MFVAHVVQYNNSGTIKAVSRSRDELFMCFLAQLHGEFRVVQNIKISKFIWRRCMGDSMIRAAYKTEAGRMESISGNCSKLLEWFYILATRALL